MTLHEKIAQVLGWSERETQSFSLRALREMVRTASPSKLREADSRLVLRIGTSAPEPSECTVVQAGSRLRVSQDRKVEHGAVQGY